MRPTAPPSRRRLSHRQLVLKAEAETRACPPAPRGCGASPGRPCRRVLPDGTLGEELGRQLAHPPRLFPGGLPDWERTPIPEPRALDPRELAAASHR